MKILNTEVLYSLQFTDGEVAILAAALRYQIECGDGNQPPHNYVDLANELLSFLDERGKLV